MPEWLRGLFYIAAGGYMPESYAGEMTPRRLFGLVFNAVWWLITAGFIFYAIHGAFSDSGHPWLIAFAAALAWIVFCIGFTVVNGVRGGGRF